jgi:L-seryl-tRNA(Ser) seleniumtransferase
MVKDELRSTQNALRQLPSVEKLLSSTGGQKLVAVYGRSLVLEAVRQRLDYQREAILAGQNDSPSEDSLLAAAQAWLVEVIAPTLQPVINATGVIIHTNLGRAPLSAAARRALQEVADYSNLEYDLDAGGRGSRTVHAEQQLVQLTGAEAALVVNNNAAAVLLMLAALCPGRDVIISRGQLVEIGGGFRIPDVLAQSGARLVEVGTTNRTHLHDFARVLTPFTGAIMVAHHSNFKMIGFTTEPSLTELAELGHQDGIPVLFDQGSGALLDTAVYGLDPEPLVTAAIDAGVDLVSFSGDKLLGGPQAGIICGRANLVQELKRHPLARALRADKLCLAALSATLHSYLTGRAVTEIPVWQMIAWPLATLAEQAAGWAARLASAGLEAAVVDGQSTVGGGSLPGTSLPTSLVAVAHPAPDELAAALRRQPVPVIARIQDGRLLLDPRTVLPDQQDVLLEMVLRAAA